MKINSENQSGFTGMECEPIANPFHSPIPPPKDRNMLVYMHKSTGKALAIAMAGAMQRHLRMMLQYETQMRALDKLEEEVMAKKKKKSSKWGQKYRSSANGS